MGANAFGNREAPGIRLSCYLVVQTVELAFGLQRYEKTLVVKDVD